MAEFGQEHNSVSVRVRPARAEDLEAAGAILVEAFRGKFQAAFPDRMDRVARIVARTFALELKRGLSGPFVAEIGGKVAGTIALRRREDPELGWPATAILFQEVGLLRGLRAMFYLSLLDQPCGRDEVYVSDVAVAAPLRRRGIGQALMLHAEEIARAWSKRALVLDVSLGNHAARRLYRRLGYSEVKVRYSFLAGWLLGLGEWIRMKKVLPPAAP